MGLKKGVVIVEKYNEKWKNEFEKERNILAQLFSDMAISIEHVGSTSIEGLSAKPIVDIMVTIKSLEDFEKIKFKFTEELNYSVKEDSAPGEILVRKVVEEYTMHLIHIVEHMGQRHIDTILFRNYLRQNHDELKRYEELKKELAQKYFDNRKMYTASKNDYIVSVINKAKNSKI